ncbi:hypothetical protein ADK34_29980 [Streptomyces viridochromogenes]|uniref:Uncharacterized protein n=1 Tax=Streptomyces viridochromogenes TaxID=1938 RepID=A0A0L8JK08_STRVR|nr:hypothetical protein ADK34_29980 [Streptomyces viridochromogenes]
MTPATIGFAATPSAGIVSWLLGDRLVSLTGRRALPRSGHVPVIAPARSIWHRTRDVTASDASAPLRSALGRIRR